LEFCKFKSFRFIYYVWIQLLLILIVFNSFIYPQTRADSLEYLRSFARINLFNTRFDKQLNTFYLNSQFQIYTKLDDVLIRLNENYNSTFVRSQNNNTRDEQHFNLITKYNLSNKLSLGLAGSNSVLSDNRSLAINDASVAYATLFSVYNPVDRISLAPFAGYSSNKQIGEIDRGTVYGLEGLIDDFRISDFNLNSIFRFRNEDVLPRRNLVRYHSLSVTNNFEKVVSNTLGITFFENRKDFYFIADSITSAQFNINNNIQSRTETGYQLQDRLSYDRFLEIFTLDLAGAINWRKIDRETRYRPLEVQSSSLFDTKIEELKLEFDAIVKYDSKNFDGILRANYYERDEKHAAKRFTGIDEKFFEQRSEIEEQKNNNSSRATLSLFGNLKISKSDRLTFSAFQSKLIYDTPSSLNADDRDEILTIFRLRYSKKLSAYFTGFINAEGTYGHTVYLFASRSSNNNESRIIRLKAGGDFTGSSVYSFNSFEVSANYTTYDFEDITSNFQSFSFRQFTAVDSTTIRFGDKISLINYSYIKLSEIGDFRWNDFVSRPTRFLEEIYLEPRLALSTGNSILSSGLRIFILNTYNFKKEEKVIDTEYLSIGPLVAINLYLWKNLNILLNGYYEFITATESQDREQASLIMQVNWKF